MSENQEGLIRDYIETERPGFALMVTGEWGCGKTYNVKKTASKYCGSGGYVYASLFGISSKEQIESTFFSFLFPSLDSPGVHLVRGLIGSIASVSVKSASSGTVNLRPQIDITGLRNKLNDLTRRVIIFDDLERALLPVDEIFGYVNHLVEHQGCRVIIIANEERLLSPCDLMTSQPTPADGSSSSANSILNIKEKLVGHTLQLRSNPNETFDHFLADFNTQWSDVLRDHKEVLLNLWGLSGYSNLRSLRIALRSFGYLYSKLTNDAKKNKVVVGRLAQIHLILLVESRKGLTEQEFMEFAHALIFRSTGSPAIAEKAAKYRGSFFTDMRGLLLSSNLWCDIVVHSRYDQDRIASELIPVLYLHPLGDKSSIPIWMHIHNMWNLSDSDMSESVISLQDTLERHIFSNVGDLLHSVGILLYLSDEGYFIRLTKTEIVQHASESIKHARINNSMETRTSDVFTIDNDDLYMDHRFIGLQVPEFKEVLDEASGYERDIKMMGISQSIPSFLDKLATNPIMFVQTLLPVIAGVDPPDCYEGLYAHTPILNCILPQVFVRCLMSLKPRDSRVVLKGLAKRHKWLDQDPYGFVKEEMEWFGWFIKSLRDESATRMCNGMWSGYWLKKVIDEFFPHKQNTNH